MNRVAIAAFLVSFFALSSSAIAQDKPRGAGAAGMAAQAEPRSPAAPVRRGRANVDARACLELPTIVQIIKCAEKYR